jgi:CHAD domain-containing protein
MKDDDKNQIGSYAADLITRHTAILQTCIEHTKGRKEIEDIHDLRVASRRVRIALDIFRQFLPAKKFKNWEPAVAKLTKTFGNARDLDVQTEFIRNFFQKNDDIKMRPGGRRLRLRLEQRRTRWEKRLQEKLTEIEKTGLLKEIISELKPQLRSKTENIIPPSPIFTLSFDVINKRLDEFLFYEIYLPFPNRIKELHLMRIAAKHLRYSLETFAPLYPDQLEKILEIMRSVQTGLGEIRDCDVWLAYLPQFLEKEKKRVMAYFGNSRPFQRLVPGIQLVLEDRKSERAVLYTKFLADWKTWRTDETWSNLRQTIFNPVLANPSIPNLNAEKPQQ